MKKRVLWKHERRIVRAYAEVALPLDAASPEMDLLINRLDEHLWYMRRDKRLAWRFCLWTLEFLALFYHGSCRRMSSLSADNRLRYVKSFHGARWWVRRSINWYLELILFVNYYSLPEVERRIGYDRRFKPAGGSPHVPSTNLVRDFPSEDVFEEADVCVIGSGAGGALAAMSLAQAGRKVVILEEGAFFDTKDFGQDGLTMVKMLYRDGGVVLTVGCPPIVVPLGCCVGGTTVINSGTCFRTPAKVFHWWGERFGLSNWSPERIEPYYRRVEELLEVGLPKEDVHGASGRIFARGARQLGVGLQPVPRNARGCTGSGVCCWGCPTNAKKSLQLNAIPLALQAGARLYPRCRAQRISFKRHHVNTVVARFVDPVNKVEGPRLTVKARSVVVSCGTLHTPVLLGRSGIPDPSRQRGSNLTLQPAAKVSALMDEEVRGWEGIPQGFYSDALVDEGITLEEVFLPPAFTAGSLYVVGNEHHEAMANYNRLATFGMLVTDTSRGRIVRALGGNFVALYNVNRHDLQRYQKGVVYMVKAFFAAGAKKVFTCINSMPVVTRKQGAGAIANLKLRRKDLVLQSFHPLGTCRMGADPSEAVLDSSGRVYGLDNLFVADGSMFPTPLGVNPQTTIMAAALKVADYINKEYL